MIDPKLFTQYGPKIKTNRTVTRRYRLSDLLDMRAMQKLADANYAIAGLPISILDAFDGTVLVASGWQDICTKFHRVNPLSNAQCISGNIEIQKQFATDGIREYKCQMGLWHIGISIVAGGDHLATLFLSQFLYEGEIISREFFTRQAQEFGYDIESYLDALNRIPLFSRSKVDTVISYYKVLADFISNLADQVRYKMDADEGLVIAHSNLILANADLKNEIACRKQAEIELSKVDRALRTLSRSYAAIVHATNEQSLANEICRIIAEEGKYLMAWIGYPQDNEEKRVVPYAFGGFEDGYLRAIKVSWKDDKWGHGPTGTAIRTGVMCVRNNRLDDPFMAPWREEAEMRGFASAIGLPLSNGAKCFGSLTIYASQTDVFIEEECILLKELADNVAFGIISVRMREQNRRAEKEIKISRDRLRDLAAHLHSVREEERMAIAREIHDELGQMLTALKLNLSRTARASMDSDNLSGEHLKSDIDMINAIIQSVKRICTELRPSILDHLGLCPAIEWQAQEFNKRTGIKCSVNFDPENISVDSGLAIALFRIFQESLTNVLRHADATEVNTALTKKGNAIILKIADNGIGITTGELSKPNSFGLLGMRERVYPWGGAVNIKGRPNKGTKITVKIPLSRSF